jgi:hypothetical protein
MQNLSKNIEYKELLNKIGLSFLTARKNAIKAINSELTLSNWNTGKYIAKRQSKSRIWKSIAKSTFKRFNKTIWQRI